MPHTEIPFIDLSTTIDYTKLRDAFELEMRDGIDADGLYERLGRQGLVGMLDQIAPVTHSQLRAGRRTLNQNGALLLHGTEIENEANKIAEMSAIVISAAFGTPSRTDQKINKIAWPIHYDKFTTLKRTFSQSLGEAALHTDTQYFDNPEKYFGLFCIKADVPGKGTNELIDGMTAISEFESEYGREKKLELEKLFPFKVPSVFTRSASDKDVEITWAPIVDALSGNIRYRNDTVLEALSTEGIDIEDSQQESLQLFDALLGNMQPVSYHLEPGDALLVNNHRMLHARTAFDDPERFLYRVRMHSND